MIRTQPAPFNSRSKSIENVFQITQYKSVAGHTLLHLFSVKLYLRLSPVRDIICHHHHLHYHSLQLMFLLGLHFSPSVILADTSDPFNSWHCHYNLHFHYGVQSAHLVRSEDFKVGMLHCYYSESIKFWEQWGRHSELSLFSKHLLKAIDVGISIWNSTDACLLK